MNGVTMQTENRGANMLLRALVSALLLVVSGCVSTPQGGLNGMGNLVIPSPIPLPFQKEIPRKTDGRSLGVERKYASATGNVTIIRQFGHLPYDTPSERMRLHEITTRGFVHGTRRQIAWREIGKARLVSTDCIESELAGTANTGGAVRALKRTYFGKDIYHVAGFSYRGGEYSSVEQWVRSIHLTR